MTLAYKIRKAFRLETYLRGMGALRIRDFLRLLKMWRNPVTWSRAEQRGRQLTVAKLLAKLDAGELERIRAHYASGKQSHWTKYLDVEKWLRTNIKNAHRLDMIHNPPRDVLDLGCGMGCFLFVCRQLGCRGLGLDLDTDPIFNEMIELFGVERIGGRIEPFEKLPDFGRKFDLITAFMICFNNFDTDAIWGAPQWGFLIDDLSGRLKPNGRILFSLNHQLDGVLYPEPIYNLFVSRGAKIEGKEVMFTKAGLDATASYSMQTILG